MTLIDNIMEYSQASLTESQHFALRCVEVGLIKKFIVYPPLIWPLQPCLQANEAITIKTGYVYFDWQLHQQTASVGGGP